MPKQTANVKKTSKAAQKRFRADRTKIRRKAAFRAHNLAKQNTKRRKQKIGGQLVVKADQERVSAMLGER